MVLKMAVFFIFWKWPIYLRIYYGIWAQKVCSHAICKVPPFTCFSGDLLRVLFYSFRMWVQDSHFSFKLISVSAQFTSHELMFMCSRALSRCHAFPVLMFSTSSQFSHLNPDQSQIQFPPDHESVYVSSSSIQVTFSSKYIHHHVWKLKLLECQPLI